MKYEVITAPASLVVPLADAKEYLGIIHDDKNARILSLSAAAEAYVENATRRFLLDRTIEAYFDSFYHSGHARHAPSYNRIGTCFNFHHGHPSIVIEHRPHVYVLSVEYYDTDGNLQELTGQEYADDYEVDAKGLDTVLKFNNTPDLDDRPNPIIVTYVVGYGDADGVPELLKSAIKQLIYHWYWNQGPAVIGTIVSPIPFTVQSILDQFRVVEV